MQQAKIQITLTNFDPHSTEQLGGRPDLLTDFLHGNITPSFKKVTNFLGIENDEVVCTRYEQNHNMMGRTDLLLNLEPTGRRILNLVNDEDPFVRQHSFDWPLIYRQICDKNYPPDVMKFDNVIQVEVPQNSMTTSKLPSPPTTTMRVVNVTVGYIRSRAYEQLSQFLPLSEFEIMHWRAQPTEASRELLTYLLH